MQDYLADVDWYESRQPGLGWLFRRAMRQVETRLLLHPESAPLVDRDFRGALLRGFPYQLAYRVENSVIRVYARSIAPATPNSYVTGCKLRSHHGCPLA
ncbi:MAG: type II toxin-antitoxin system RelE/ParE family toxin [Planctomycetes bacterium]|nr:type II toxin-antitoxin system RelE/ParE family toxin [Planctomycetota bacterium]